ncbi:MAG: hypothetical protein KAS01_00045 [Candidatus Pacebacteria bacterium]|nr:hypothetical protein [Candidatus Paceibacterota bacterium]
MLIWIDFAFLARVIQNQIYFTILFLKVAWFVTPVFFLFLYFFTIYLIKESYKYRFLSMVVLLIGVITTVFTGLTDLVVSDANFVGSDLRIVYGLGMVPFLIVVLLIIYFTLYPLIKKYLSVSTKERIKLEYFIIGIFIFYLANIIFNIILPVFFDVVYLYYFGDYSTIILLIFTAYAITRHELMGIKTLVTQMLIIVMSIILLIDITLLSDNFIMQLLKVGVLITFLYFGRGLIISIKKEKKVAKKLQNANEKIKDYVDRLEDINKNLEEGNEDLKALLDASSTVIENMDSKKIAQGIVDIIPKSLGHLGNKGGVFIVYDREKKIISPYAITESDIVKKAKKFLTKSITSYKVLIKKTDSLTARTIREKKIFVGNKLGDFISPPVSLNACKMIQKVVRAKSFVSVPLYARGDVIGVLLFVGTKKAKDITKRDKNILNIFSSHIGNAVENARLYEQTNKQIKELARLNNDLGGANSKLKELLEMKNEFLHITSHQLRTPLTAIRGMVSMWSDGDFDSLSEKEKKNMIKRILISTDRLNNITNDMLDALELEGGFLKFQFKSVSLKNILKETINTLKPNFDKKGIYLRLNFDSKITNVEVEPNYIRQVFMNTIDNACKYTKKGGVDINVKNNKGYFEIKIKDTGVGINKIDQKKIFEKFTRGRNAAIENASGSGLGLFIARKIIKAHDGKIEISSDGLNKGATIKIFLKIKHNKNYGNA